MRTLSWGLRKARIWLDEVPDWMYQPSEVITRSSDVSRSGRSAIRECAIELFVPTGAMAYYGALGATFTPQNKGVFTVRIPISKDGGKLLKTALAGKMDEVHIGLPEEYVEGILENFLRVDTVQQLGAGTLLVCEAAYGNIGSSVWFFGVLSRTLSKLFLLEDVSLPDEAFIELIRSELSRQ